MKYILKIVTCTLSLILIMSCSNEDTDRVFEESASDRLNNSITQYKNLLKNSENGWVLQYFPDRKQAYGGYNYVVKFKDNKVVDVMSELQADFSKSVSSSYNVISYGGPVLSFDGYNTLMHFFSTPSRELYEAYDGDFEFFLMSEKENVVTLRGNKTGNKMKLIKLNETSEAYLKKISSVANYFSGTTGVLTINNKTYPVNLTNRHLVIKPTDSDEIDVAYIYTTDGIKLYKEVTINGNKVIEFKLNKTDGQLISKDTKVVIDLIKTPFNLNQNWKIKTFSPDISQSFFKMYVQIYKANVKALKHKLSRTIYFGNTTVRSKTTPGIMFISNGYGAQYFLSFSGVLGKPKQLSISKVGGGLNWRFFPHLEPLIDLMVDNAPYTTELDDSVNPSKVKLVSTVDPNFWFTVKL